MKIGQDNERELYNRKQSAYKQRRYAERRDLAITTLGRICARCGAWTNLEIDHIEAEKKEHEVMTDLYCLSILRFLAELSKCQLLCKTCHISKSASERRKTKKTLTAESRQERLAYIRDWKRKKRRDNGCKEFSREIMHGTRAGYLKEVRLRVIHCDACRKANAEYAKKLRIYATVVSTD